MFSTSTIASSTNSPIATAIPPNVMVLIAVTAPEEKRRRLSAFIVEKPWDGLSIGKLEKKLGIKCSTTAA